MERYRRGSVKIASDGAYDFADLFGRVRRADNRDRRRRDFGDNESGRGNTAGSAQFRSEQVGALSR